VLHDWVDHLEEPVCDRREIGRKRELQALLPQASRLMRAIGMLNLRHHSLVAWQRADDLFINLHKLTIQSFPSFERYELGSQLRKAAYSVPANIAEGFGRRHRRERLHFLNISEASLAEVAYCIHAAWRLGYLTDPMLEELEKSLNGVGAPLSGLIRSIAVVDVRLNILAARPARPTHPPVPPILPIPPIPPPILPVLPIPPYGTGIDV
jgi:four helix bundle protein